MLGLAGLKLSGYDGGHPRMFGGDESETVDELCKKNKKKKKIIKKKFFSSSDSPPTQYH